MKLKIGEKEFNIKFGYKPTLKEKIVSKVVRFSKNSDIEDIENLLLFLPEFLLVGLQVYHEEYRYDYDSGEGRDKQLEAATLLVEKYLENENSDIMELFNILYKTMTEDSFLSSLFRTRNKKTEQTIENLSSETKKKNMKEN